jgi:RNA polymerase sigma factor (sigma-70 family)
MMHRGPPGWVCDTAAVNDQQFRAMLETEIPRLRRVVARLAPVGVDPDDLAQDTLERAWRSRTSYRAEAAPATWLYRIALNRAYDLAARGGPVLVDVDDLAEDDLFDFEVDDPAEVLAKAHDTATLRAALSRLSPVDRMVLALHDGEGWGAREVGQACGIGAAAAHKRVQRGRFRLAKELTAGSPPRPARDELCTSVRALAPDYLDGTLDEHRSTAVEDHIRACELCPPLAQAVLGLREALERGVLATGIHADTRRFLRVLADRPEGIA